ncbi:DUF4405 domain-containing protein [Roseibium litorale]|uniref:DUF4405 domain-containing protein n=1 Tax=Roseibium litorale TaxID=2803841 RepID=A0ABR9CPQ6_9HYPH|nr:DUF4405 domain-containing protein [Roseibium litorale]MBD8892241.1 DUF4405 domain-containing protein [Roseibium litorale]
MSKFFSKYATPFTTGLFLVSLISGIALFFHFGPAAFHGMHEWLSMVLILPFVLHIWKNWRPFVCYFKRLPMLIALAASVAASAVFFIPSENEGGGNPLVGVLRTVQAAPVSLIAPLYGLDTAELTAKLNAAGMPPAGPDQSLADIASSNGKSDRDMAVFLAGLKP